jgi:hypothetical protein
MRGLRFVWLVFLARANLMFAGIRYKHLEYMMCEASPLSTRNDAAQIALGFSPSTGNR